MQPPTELFQSTSSLSGEGQILAKAQEGGWWPSGKQSGGGDLHGPDHIQEAMDEQTCAHE